MVLRGVSTRCTIWAGVAAPKHMLLLLCRLGQYKQVPSLSGSIPSSPYSAPELWVANALTQHVSAMQFFFCVSTIKTELFQLFVCQICSVGSVVRAVRYITERLPVLIQAVRFCPCGESARTLFRARIFGIETHSFQQTKQISQRLTRRASERPNPSCTQCVWTNLFSLLLNNCLTTGLHVVLKWDFRTDRCTCLYFLVLVHTCLNSVHDRYVL